MWLIVVLLIFIPANAFPQQELPLVATPKADVTVTSSPTLVMAANTNRSAANCTNSDSSVHVRWGNSSVSASAGQQLRATQSIEILFKGDIYMISEGGSVTVSCTEEATK